MCEWFIHTLQGCRMCIGQSFVSLRKLPSQMSPKSPFIVWLYEYHLKINCMMHGLYTTTASKQSQNYNLFNLVKFVWLEVYSLATDCWAPQAFY